MFGHRSSCRRILRAVPALLCLSAPCAQAHRAHARTHAAGATYCTFYRDRHGRTASSLAPRGSWVLLSRGGTTMRIRITDSGCNHFDLTPAEFRRFAPLSRGVVRGVRWRVLPRR